MLFLMTILVILIWMDVNHLIDAFRIMKKFKLIQKTRSYRLYGCGLLLILVIFQPLLLFLLPLCILLLLKVNKRQQKGVIEYYGYKIFKYLLNQISSGILVSDAIQSMYMVVKESKLRHLLINVSAYYAQTSDIHGALQILKKDYKGVEVDTLCVAIEQGISTGANAETLTKMEELLFKRYIFQIKRDTELKRKRGILAVLFLCLVIVLMVAVPISIDIGRAFNQIFY